MAAIGDTSGEERPSLDQILIYLLTKASKQQVGSGIKVPISDVHDIVAPLEADLNREFDIPVKFHRSSEDVHSRQVERALNDVIPYKIPVRNPSFSLEISENIRDMALERVSEELADDQQDVLDEMVENEEFQDNVDEFAESLES